MRSRESRRTKFTLPTGRPSMRSASTREVPSRNMSSRQSVPKLEIRKLPSRSKASPLGSVPSRYREASVPAVWKCPEFFCEMMVCDPSGQSRTTPPRASAVQSVPSRSARMHSGRWRSWPTYRSVLLSIPKSKIWLSGTSVAFRAMALHSSRGCTDRQVRAGSFTLSHFMLACRSIIDSVRCFGTGRPHCATL